MTSPLNDYAGAIHVHTRHSDGSGTVPEVISAAQKAEIDFLIITDHNNMRAQRDGAEGWYGHGHKNQSISSSKGHKHPQHPILVLVGEEITKREGDCLALNVPHNGLARKKADEYIPLIHNQNGLTFLCHPHFGPKPQFMIRDSSWKRWDVFQNQSNNKYSTWPTGLELWSHLGDWAEDLTWGSFLSHARHPEKYIEGPNTTTLKMYDELTQKHPLVAFGGLDAHAKTVLPFNKGVIIPYIISFRALRTRILAEPLTGEWQNDSQKVYSALGKGHCYISYDYLASGKGFMFEAVDHNQHPLAIMGNTIPYTDKIQLIVKSPQSHSKVRLIRNGQLLIESNEPILHHPITDKGVYRAEIYFKETPWIYSNPIYIR